MSRLAACRLRLESLEARHALAGNVIAMLTEGTLTILGDEQANGVNMVFDVASGKHIVSGTETGGSATEINGGTTPAEFSGVKHVHVMLGEGDDVLDFGAADQIYTGIAQKLAIDMGSGNDSVELGRAGNGPGATDPVYHLLYVNKGIWIDLGAGDDELSVASLKTNKSLIVLAGDGNDAIDFATEFTPTGAAGATQFPVIAKGNVHLHLGHGDDTLTVLHVRVGNNLKILDPQGASNVSLTDVDVRRKVDIKTGHSVDQVSLDYVSASHVSMNTHGAEDDVSIEHSRFKRMNVQTGGGNDDLDVRWSRSTQFTFLDGGDQGGDVSLRGNALRGMIKRRLS